jgi:hypothetical protein
MGANAQTSVPTFTAGQVLTAAQMNTSARTGVPVAADAAARDGLFGGTGEKTLAEGQLVYLEDLNVVQYYDGAVWATVGPAAASGVVQVKSTVKTDTFTASVATGAKTAITGVSVSITPTSASNKVLVIAQITGGQSGAGVGTFYQLMRGATAIGIGDAASSRQVVTSGILGDPSVQAAECLVSGVMVFLDSPATTSATTYSVDVSHASASTQTVYVNRSQADSNNGYIARGASTITVFEVTP